MRPSSKVLGGTGHGVGLPGYAPPNVRLCPDGDDVMNCSDNRQELPATTHLPVERLDAVLLDLMDALTVDRDAAGCLWWQPPRAADPAAEHAGWLLDYTGVDPDGEGTRETLCTLGNGYLATRGAGRETDADPVHYPGTYIAGVFNRLHSRVHGHVHEDESLVRLPNWLVLRWGTDEGRWVAPDGPEVSEYRQSLDLRAGVLHRRYRHVDHDGRATTVVSKMLVSMAEPHLAAMDTTFVPENWSGTLHVRSAIDGQVANQQVAEYAPLAGRHLQPDGEGHDDPLGLWLRVRTSQSRIGIAVATRTQVLAAGAPATAPAASRHPPPDPEETYDIPGQEGQPVRVEKVAAYYTSRDRAITEPATAARQAAAQAGSFDDLFTAHVHAWRRLWERSHVALHDGRTPFPWQPGSDGREETPTELFNTRNNRWMPHNSSLQRHVGLAISYSVWQYYQATGDLDFMRTYNAELMLEIARFFADLAHENQTTGRYEITGVMGPDEFHDGYSDSDVPGLANNAYTNIMTVWLLHRALDVVDLLACHHCAGLPDRLGIDEDELARWRDITSRMYVPWHDDQIISQFDEYADLAEFDLPNYIQRYGNIGRLDLILAAEGDTPNRYQIGKQADVLMLLYLLSARGTSRPAQRSGLPVAGAGAAPHGGVLRQESQPRIHALPRCVRLGAGPHGPRGILEFFSPRRCRPTSATSTARPVKASTWVPWRHPRPGRTWLPRFGDPSGRAVAQPATTMRDEHAPHAAHLPRSPTAPHRHPARPDPDRITLQRRTSHGARRRATPMTISSGQTVTTPLKPAPTL